MTGYTLGGYQVGLRGRFRDGSVLVETFLWSRRARVWQPTGTFTKVHRHQVHKAGADWHAIRSAFDALPLIAFAPDEAGPPGGAAAAEDERPSRQPGARLHAHYALPEEN